MTDQKTVYIALGSNKGDKFKNLQNAVDAVFTEVGNVVGIAKVFQSKAFGFEGEDFFNTCIAVSTVFKPKKVLSLLQQIEKKLGRTPKQSEGYESRVIDLDIIFFEDQIVDDKNLIIPHPAAHKRRFVLEPLQLIAGSVMHPILQRSVQDLLLVCEDKSELEEVKIWLKNPNKKFSFSKHNYIAIEGNIGAGKTSLTTQISEDFNAKLVLERFADNPFLPKFYKEPQRYAFTLEMSFLADRYQQITDDLGQLDLFKDFIVSDYDVFKSLIFSKITLQPDEFKLYRKLFYLMYKDIPKPDLYVYLYQNTERLQANIKKRGRKYESEIEDDYLDKINAGYLEFLKSQTDFNIKIIDISDKDFVKNRADYLWLMEQICEHDA
ncbi:2-amino-4-hydroxy-6-hydroxymethyldihydropteridine diphosphokinase [Psychroserpens sp. NJDZ02]|uniref:2-amino-4-hydroxy-6- hydroxymethyldihydropteridine diphosphokinase n=1 Tax=Psychroserpens sp. NJDZ02 TaxID=2570561 RepID=UPI0010A8484B|nr:2-amino-4-hydroxy-6-hydroxymethyldihydropteridine diphosphokinase [Psychroserpens sp. NJDZ02]QCE41632.1 2-amino-4-hydroxy-6-hydroxymethyldihydropteridine diphosphokinase [Psychroserpens sp. NJDZ02]